MDRRRPDQGWRAMAMAVALSRSRSILQPLAHAALLATVRLSVIAALCHAGAT